MFYLNKFLLMTGFEPRTSGIGSDRHSGIYLLSEKNGEDTAPGPWLLGGTADLSSMHFVLF